MTASDLLADARGLLVEHGWTKGAYHKSTGELCAVGALAAAVKGHAHNIMFKTPDARAAMDRLCQAADARGYLSVTCLNDAKATTFADVLDLYDDAIVAAKEAGQ